MKIAVISGSPKGKESNTNLLVSAFLEGAKEVGAETQNVFLSDLRIEHCKGCHVCWSKGPMQCVIQDDMLKALSSLHGADIIIFATPVYFGNISGMLKVFMDRLTMLGSPHSQSAQKSSESSHNSEESGLPKLMIMATCGHPRKEEFEVISLWMARAAKKLRMPLIGEIYAAGGRVLMQGRSEQTPDVIHYLQLLKTAGKEVVQGGKMTLETERQLDAMIFK